MTDNRLTRSADKMIGGVCAGVAEYFHLKPSLVRTVWVLLLLLYGFGAFLYVALLIVMPRKRRPHYEERMHKRLKKTDF